MSEAIGGWSPQELADSEALIESLRARAVPTLAPGAAEADRFLSMLSRWVRQVDDLVAEDLARTMPPLRP